jgi:hypothetical protein
MNTLPLERLRPVREICLPPPLDDVVAASLETATEAPRPFRHLRLRRLLPTRVLTELSELPYAPPSVQPVVGLAPGEAARTHTLALSGPGAVAVCRSLARSLAAPAVRAQIRRRADVDVCGRPLRLRLIQAIDGYACPPQTAEGESLFRIVVALPPSHQGDLGPDLYADPQTWAAQLSGAPGAAFAFAPAADTWHGFEPRMIRRQRVSLVIDYLPG